MLFYAKLRQLRGKCGGIKMRELINVGVTSGSQRNVEPKYGNLLELKFAGKDMRAKKML